MDATERDSGRRLSRLIKAPRHADCWLTAPPSAQKAIAMNPDPALASAESGESALTVTPVSTGLFEDVERKKSTRLSDSLALGFARLFGLEPFLTDIVTRKPANSSDQSIRFDL
jgi:hypothetical protein